MPKKSPIIKLLNDKNIEIRHRTTHSGRPKHIYAFTDKQSAAQALQILKDAGYDAQFGSKTEKTVSVVNTTFKLVDKSADQKKVPAKSKISFDVKKTCHLVKAALTANKIYFRDAAFPAECMYIYFKNLKSSSIVKAFLESQDEQVAVVTDFNAKRGKGRTYRLFLSEDTLKVLAIKFQKYEKYLDSGKKIRRSAPSPQKKKKVSQGVTPGVVKKIVVPISSIKRSEPTTPVTNTSTTAIVVDRYPDEVVINVIITHPVVLSQLVKYLQENNPEALELAASKVLARKI